MKSSPARNRLRILYFRTALQGITVYIVRNRVETRFVVIIVETAIFTWKRLWYEGTRHPEAASVGTGPRSSDGIDLPSWWRANRDHVGQSRDKGGKETQRFSPRFFRNDFFARDRPSNPVTSFQPKNRVKASVINAPWFLSFRLFFSSFFIYFFFFSSRIASNRHS